MFLRDQAEESGPKRQHHGTRDRQRFLRHQGSRRLGRWQVSGIRDARPDTAKSARLQPPTWRIWEYDIATDDLHSITDDVTASEGEDISPHYLPSDSAHPNGRILIASTRQRDSKLVLLTEGKSGFEAQTEDVRESAFTLSVLDPTQTGPSAFQQISFNPSHDINPTVLSDGRILYTRWSHTRLQVTNGMHLYTINPDGTNDQLLFGAHSHFIGTADPAQRGCRPPCSSSRHARCRMDVSWRSSARPTPAPISEVTWSSSMSTPRSNAFSAPARPARSRAAPILPADDLTATTNDVRTIPGPSPGGRFNSAYPLWDGTRPDTGELGRVPVAQFLRRDRPVHRRQSGRPERADCTAAVQRLAAQPGQQHLQARRTPYRRRSC